MNLNTKIERAIVTALVAELGAADYVPVKVYDGGEYVEATSVAQVLDAVFSVDESTVHFAERGDADNWGKRGVFLVCGNGEDLISDWHTRDALFDAAVKRAVERIANLKVTA